MGSLPLTLTVLVGCSAGWLCSAGDKIRSSEDEVWLPMGRGYIGCFQGGTTDFQYFDANMTLDSCKLACLDDDTPYNFYGVLLHNECYCNQTIDSSLATSEHYCHMPCGGNVSQICGGGFFESVYSTS